MHDQQAVHVLGFLPVDSVSGMLLCQNCNHICFCHDHSSSFEGEICAHGKGHRCQHMLDR